MHEEGRTTRIVAMRHEGEDQIQIIVLSTKHMRIIMNRREPKVPKYQGMERERWHNHLPRPRTQIGIQGIYPRIHTLSG